MFSSISLAQPSENPAPGRFSPVSYCTAEVYCTLSRWQNFWPKHNQLQICVFCWAFVTLHVSDSPQSLSRSWMQRPQLISSGFPSQAQQCWEFCIFDNHNVGKQTSVRRLLWEIGQRQAVWDGQPLFDEPVLFKTRYQDVTKAEMNSPDQRRQWNKGKGV